MPDGKDSAAYRLLPTGICLLPAKGGAEGGTRTPTVLLPPAPQAGASANSATSAFRGLIENISQIGWFVCQSGQARAVRYGVSDLTILDNKLPPGTRGKYMVEA